MAPRGQSDEDTGRGWLDRLAWPVAGIWVLAVALLTVWGGWQAVLPLAAVAVAVLPVAVIALFAGQMRANEHAQAEVARLEARIAALRQEMTVKAAGLRRSSEDRDFAAASDVMAPRPQAARPARSEPRIISEAPPPPPPAQGRAPSLALVVEDPDGQLDRGAFIRALNFPEDDRDTEGLAAMRRALKDRAARAVIQAAQDVLTLVSRDGIYMEDVPASEAGPDAWRRFVEGARGAQSAALAENLPDDKIETVKARMQADGIFRDTALHFTRRFDEMLSRFVPQARDADLDALAQTRSARAYLLMARASGTFD